VVSFLHTSQPKFSTHFSSSPCTFTKAYLEEEAYETGHHLTMQNHVHFAENSGSITPYTETHPISLNCSSTHRPDDGGSKDLWNVGKFLPDYTALQPRRQPSSFSPLCEPQTLLLFHSSNLYYQLAVFPPHSVMSHPETVFSGTLAHDSVTNDIRHNESRHHNKSTLSHLIQTYHGLVLAFLCLHM
jgi:hypothetical protein